MLWGVPHCTSSSSSSPSVPPQVSFSSCASVMTGRYPRHFDCKSSTCDLVSIISELCCFDWSIAITVILLLGQLPTNLVLDAISISKWPAPEDTSSNGVVISNVIESRCAQCSVCSSFGHIPHPYTEGFVPSHMSSVLDPICHFILPRILHEVICCGPIFGPMSIWRHWAH